MPAVEVVDTVGAGDTFGGAMLAWLVHAGAPGRRSADRDAVLPRVRFGVRASSIVCQRPGADPPTLAELGGWPAATAPPCHEVSVLTECSERD